MNETAATSMAALVRKYLADAPQHQAWVEQLEPLRRPVQIRSSVWHPWLAYGGDSANTRSYCGPLPEHVSAPATDLLRSLPLVEPPEARRDRVITRPILANLAAEAHRSRADEDLVRLWVATMMWGSGTSYGRGPWRTAQGLADEALLAVLRVTLGHLAAGNVQAAYREFKVDGCGESFFTKWLWAASLAEDRPTPRPLILDDRVRGVLSIANEGSTSWKQPRGSNGYIGYLEHMSTTASLLRETIGAGMTSEKLEWLMFERQNPSGPGDNTSELCLIEWLRQTGERNSSSS